MKAHQLDPFSTRFGEPHFAMRGIREADDTTVPDLRETCSYCGSISIDGMLEAMRTPGTRYSGSDWKYGWPHKFYVDIPCEPYERIYSTRYEGGEKTHERMIDDKRFHKFYSTHLTDATPEQMTRWNEVCAPLLGVRYQLDPDGTLCWSARLNYQASGIVGKTRCSKCDGMASPLFPCEPCNSQGYV